MDYLETQIQFGWLGCENNDFFWTGTMMCVNQMLEARNILPCKLGIKKETIDGQVFPCTDNRNHQMSIRKFSYFSDSKHQIPDVFKFLDGHLLHKCSQFSNISYGCTSVYCANYIRDLFIQYVYDEIVTGEKKLSREVEGDQSLFGRKCRYHRGQIKSRVQVWVLGLVERGSGKMILLSDRKER